MKDIMKRKGIARFYQAPEPAHEADRFEEIYVSRKELLLFNEEKGFALFTPDGNHFTRDLRTIKELISSRAFEALMLSFYDGEGDC